LSECILKGGGEIYMTTLLIDFDVIVYRAGWAANKGDYLMNVEYVDNIVMSMIDRFAPCRYQGYLTGKNNFRYDKATILPYKGNRVGKEKPVYYKQIREYLTEFWHAETVNGMEADDAMGLNQTEETIICSIDKDLLMIPGKHYNFVKGELTKVSPEQGIYNFFKQMLVGDRSDNIPGIAGIGEVKSTKMLCDKSPKQQLKIVSDLYNKTYGEKDGMKYFDEVATLLWIQRDGEHTYKESKLIYG
jgi:hypothetical protein